MPINIDNISYSYGINTPFEKKALSNVSVDINDGELWLFVGHTGSGKSTMINMINGLLVPQSGSVKVDGMGTADKNINIREIRKKVGLIFQYPESQFFLPTIAEEFTYAAKNFGVSFSQQDLFFYMKLMGLPKEYLNKSPFNLSGGEMRKVAIISVLSYNPSYIIFDEPTVGLDYKTRVSIFETVKKLNSIGKTIILVTHWISEFLALKPKVLMMKESNVVFKGEFDDFIRLDEKILEQSGIIFDDKLTLYKELLIANNPLKDKITIL
ncbi:MAG TPA: ATP-binding cassette domain-containing protein [Tepiditoga sp.]|nr:ATP-binding cassette domain-containing protein [Tepiditoga sp.]